MEHVYIMFYLGRIGEKTTFYVNTIHEYFSLSLCGVFCCGFLMGFFGGWGLGGILGMIRWAKTIMRLF